MNDFEKYFSDQLNQRRANGNHRSLSVYSEGVDFISNDYLSWAESRSIDRLVADKLEAFNGSLSGSTGSRLMSGNTKSIEALESRIAHVHDAEAALVFNSGYNANLGLLQAVSDRSTTLICDALVHASLLDATQLCQKRNSYKFRHNDLVDLRVKLEHAQGKKLVVVESVYSMDGDVSPLHEVAKLCREYGAMLIVDEAHGIGVMGKKGLGLSQDLELKEVLLARVYTYGKAMACHGAAVVGSKLLIDFLINFSRPFIYTTALPMHAILSIDTAYDLLLHSELEREKLSRNISDFRELARHHGIGLIDSTSAIQCMIVGTNERTKSVANGLLEAGFRCKAILHPTVPEGLERIRFCLHANHEKKQYEALFEKLKANEN